MVDQARILNTAGKFAFYLSEHNSICVSVSGGSDSDIIVHIIAEYFREYLPKIKFVFANTGIEYRATLNHLKYLEERYNIMIEEVRGMPIPVAVKKYGVPFCSKKVSETIARLQKHDFLWENEDFKTLFSKYPRCKSSLRWWLNDWGEVSRFNISWNKGLKEFFAVNPPHMAISAQCCTVSKKRPIFDFQKRIGCDLYITGERKSEGGARSGTHKNCFENSHGLAHFMPLWFWDNDTKEYYCKKEGIKHSNCYTVYGLKRTGCVGCPFALKLWDELAIMERYEPNCYKLCLNVFGESYQYRREFELFKSLEEKGEI